MSKKELKRIVVIGAGFGGLNAVKGLSAFKHVHITVVDRTNHHLFQPLLYQVATAALSPGDIAIPIREVFRNLPNVTTLMGTVVDINKDQNVVTLENLQQLTFDILVVCVGSRHAYFGKPAWESDAPGLKTLQDALYIREKILYSFEIAERMAKDQVRQSYMSFVVIGAGPTGIEMAGAIAEIAHQSLKRNFRNIDPTHTRIFLIESGSQVLAGYPEKFAKTAQRDLEKMGVTIRLNSRVTQVDTDGIHIGDEFIATKNIIWAAGNEASSLHQTLKVPLDKQGRVIVGKDLTIPDHDNIFVIGDGAHVVDEKGNVLAAVAPVAVQQGEYVAKIIGKDKAKENRPPFKYKDRGMMATIGKYKALVLSGPIRCSGFFAWLMWCFVHIYFLIGYRTKLFVFSQWVFYFFHGQRNIRLIIKPSKQGDRHDKT